MKKNLELTEEIKKLREPYKGIKGNQNIWKPVGDREYEDLTGRKFGRLTAVKVVGRYYDGHLLWLCECDCNNYYIASGSSLMRSKVTSCGCYTSERVSETKKSNLIGQVFRGMTVIEEAEPIFDPTGGHRRSQWVCKCNKCGEIYTIRETTLKKGTSDVCYKCRGVKKRTKHTLDLTGQTFNRWTVIRRATKDEVESKDGHSHWLCRCSCGNFGIISSTHLTSGASKSCGCYAKEQLEKTNKFNKETGKGWKVIEDLTGQVFDRLTVIKRVEDYVSPKGEKLVRYLCKCSCGNTCIRNANTLKRKNYIQSCGCHKKERVHEVHFKDLTGQRFGKLVVIKRVEDHVYPSGDKRTQYLCQCDCGNTCVVMANNLVNKTCSSCGCLLSVGELEISKLLMDNDIEFKKQKSYKDLLSDKGCRLRFDFYIPDGNYLIEFDGMYHYKCSKRIWCTEEHVSKTQYHDRLKNEYCIKNNIKLIRIPYTHLSKLCLEDLLLETSTFIIN